MSNRHSSKTSEAADASSPLLTAREAAHLLGYRCPETLWRAARSRRIPSYVLGRSVRFRKSDLEAYVRERSI